MTFDNFGCSPVYIYNVVKENNPKKAENTDTPQAVVIR